MFLHRIHWSTGILWFSLLYYYSLVFFSNIDIDNIIESSKELIKRDKERKEKERKAENKKFQESRQRNLDFFLGQKYNPKDKSTVKFDPNYNSVYLKIEGDEIFTSNFIRVPLDKSLVLYRRIVERK